MAVPPERKAGRHVSPRVRRRAATWPVGIPRRAPPLISQQPSTERGSGARSAGEVRRRWRRREHGGDEGGGALAQRGERVARLRLRRRGADLAEFQQRSREWVESTGMVQGAGRRDDLIGAAYGALGNKTGTSIFSPTLAEICYRWWCSFNISTLQCVLSKYISRN